MNHGTSTFLNLSRWVAAFLVLSSHARHLVLVDLENVRNRTPAVEALYFITGLGHEAVVIFFVISGFLVGGVTLDRWLDNGPQLSRYAIARFSRIYTALVPALIVGFALDLVGLHWLNASELYTNPAKYHTISLDNTLSGTINLSTFFGNLFMLQGILVGNLGTNSPLWSLAYEWWYYCLFALAGVALTIRTSERFAFLAAAILLALALPSKIVLWGLIWILGIAGYRWVKSSRWSVNPALGIPICCLSVIFSRLSHNVHNIDSHEPVAVEFSRDLMVALGYVIALSSISRMRYRLPLAALHHRLAEFSYTTYLIHFPILMFVVALAYQVLGVPLRVEPDAGAIVYCLLLASGIYALSYWISRYTEAKTPILRDFLTRYAAATVPEHDRPL